MDGLKLYLEQSGSHAIQNAFYNDWKHNHYVSNTFLFMPDGTICSMAAEFGFIYDKLQTLYDKCK
eukprot:14084955-Ditylum_brightwellii.AAC.1